jgi:LacI family transcriptional regulator
MHRQSPAAELSSVVPDEYGAARGAIKELLDHGHRSIGFVTNIDDVPATRGRLRGYRYALRQADVEFRRDLVVADVSETPGGYRAALQLLTRADRPTAIFAYNDRMAMGVYRAAREMGIAIPNDLSVISIDNPEILAEGLYPGLTSIALPHYDMAAWAVAHLIERLPAGDDAAGRQPIEGTVLPCPIIRRYSVAAPHWRGSYVTSDAWSAHTNCDISSAVAPGHEGANGDAGVDAATMPRAAIRRTVAATAIRHVGEGGWPFG